jgi:nitrate/nitrite transporter NarK
LGAHGAWQIGHWNAIPNAAGIVGMLVFASSSNHRRERLLHVAMACVLGAVRLTGSVFAGSSLSLAMGFLTLATFGICAALPVFWTIPPLFLAGAASAAGIALLNSIGNLAGFVSPSVVGWIKESTGSVNNGLYLVSLCLIASALALTFLRRRFAAPATIIPTGEIV